MFVVARYVFGVASSLSVAASLAGCGGPSLRYSMSHVDRLPLAQGAPIVIAEPIDARFARPTFPGADPREEIAGLREAVREHVGRAGIHGTVAPAPATPADVDQILDGASRSGAHEVVFLRFLGANSDGRLVSLASVAYIGILPWIIVDSLPLSRHGGTGFFEAIVLDPTTHDVLLDTRRVVSFSEHVNAWGYNPNTIMNGTIRSAVHHVLGDVLAARKAEYPLRAHVDNVEQFVLGAPIARLSPDRVSLPGVSFALLPGWRWVSRPADYGATLQSPSGERFVFTPERTWRNADEYGATVAAALPGPVTSQRPTVLDGHAAHEIVWTPATGIPVIQQLTSLGGLGLIFTCAPAQARATCDQMFSTVKIDGDALQEAP